MVLTNYYNIRNFTSYVKYIYKLVFIVSVLSCLDNSQETNINIHGGFIFASEEHKAIDNSHLQVSLISKGASTLHSII